MLGRSAKLPWARASAPLKRPWRGTSLQQYLIPQWHRGASLTNALLLQPPAILSPRVPGLKGSVWEPISIEGASATCLRCSNRPLLDSLHYSPPPGNHSHESSQTSRNAADTASLQNSDHQQTRSSNQTILIHAADSRRHNPGHGSGQLRRPCLRARRTRSRPRITLWPAWWLAVGSETRREGWKRRVGDPVLHHVRGLRGGGHCLHYEGGYIVSYYQLSMVGGLLTSCRIQTWALEEARRRLEKEGLLDDPDTVSALENRRTVGWRIESDRHIEGAVRQHKLPYVYMLEFYRQQHLVYWFQSNGTHPTRWNGVTGVSKELNQEVQCPTRVSAHHVFPTQMYCFAPTSRHSM